MNSIVLATLLVAILFCTVSEATVSGGMFRNPKYPGMCTLDESMILAPGSVMKNPQGECAMITCYENGQATIMRCMQQGMREGCKEGRVLYPEAKFPECCKREIMCDTYYYSNTY